MRAAGLLSRMIALESDCDGEWSCSWCTPAQLKHNLVSNGAQEWHLSHDLIGEGDFVVARSTRRVRHDGELFGVAPTGREVVVEHVEMWRVEGGKIVEHWGGLGAGGQLYRALTQP